MKTILALFMLGIVSLTRAQGPFQFQANIVLLEPFPPNTNWWGGQGTFSLEGNPFNYRVVVRPAASWTGSQIHCLGPNGPVLYDLAFQGCVPPFDTNLGLCVVRGAVEIPDSAIPDLAGKKWYVTATEQERER